ncbi:hypothetical protein OPKNFCMD_5365 [Methylobacterium crusticola]|uniref:Secreted protein n=1 Tax=Methylobacterium crusticola TaxID=1697972 RepID=A0ABQ4R629_9HYPH|nr:hypothetical protein [Methylobacterium crusticola]GJD52599.1 hypothetical protein OPKNFCMD_5365 [Methylobacterium crusticola]
METVLILAAAVAVVLSGLAVVVTLARSRRPPLRLPHEQELEDRGDALFRECEPDIAGVLDRTAPVLEARTPAGPERLAPPEAEPPHGPGTLTIDHEPGGPRSRRTDGEVR